MGIVVLIQAVRRLVLIRISKMTSDGANGYKYSPPQGGSNAPFRLLDFEGYMPEAMPNSLVYSSKASR